MSGAELIHLPNTLAKRIGPRMRVFTAGLLKQAEAALARIGEHYDDWLRQDLSALDSVRADIRANGVTAAKLKELGRCARLLRGAGSTFGYPIVSDFASHLCDAVERQKTELPAKVLDAYVDAMKAALRDQVRDPDHQTATDIVRELEASLAGS